ncbi:MAG: hypothetical protein N3A01_08985 [Bacteroidales bacterium]|nr:hypothetical protein [Bacteroidales bacterium]
MRNNSYYLFISLLLITTFYEGASQKIIDSLISFPMFSAAYMVQIPDGDLAKRYGINSNIGGSFIFKTKNNVFFEFNTNFIFGDKLKGDATHLFDSIKTSNGMIINEHGEYAKIRTFERGYFIGSKIGTILFLKYPNPNSGLLLMGGAGILQHKIRIENDGNNAPQILGEYKLGYDKMRYGFALSEFIGYIYFSRNQIINFYAGFEFYQAFTKSGREWDFNLRKKDTGKYKDLLHSIKVGWIIPIYKRAATNYYY